MHNANISRGPKHSTSTQTWIALPLLTLVTVLSGKALLEVLRLALSNQEYTHLLLIVPVVVAFLILEQTSPSSHPSRLLACLAASASIGCFLLSRTLPFSLHLTLQIAAFVVAVWAIIFWTFGVRFFRANLFPMLFLLLLIPWPIKVVENLTVLLQSGSTSAAYWLFRGFRIPVARQGFVLSLSSMDIFVAEECSGIRSTVMLLLAALVLGQLFLRSPWRKAALVLAVLPIGILRNGIRIFILSVLGIYVNEGWLEGNLHHRGGSVFFVIGLVLIVGLLWSLRRAEAGSPAGSE